MLDSSEKWSFSYTRTSFALHLSPLCYSWELTTGRNYCLSPGWLSVYLALCFTVVFHGTHIQGERKRSNTVRNVQFYLQALSKTLLFTLRNSLYALIFLFLMSSCQMGHTRRLFSSSEFWSTVSKCSPTIAVMYFSLTVSKTSWS